MPFEKTEAWGHIASFKKLLDTFINELEEMEETGLPNPDGRDRECHKVRDVMNKAVAHLFSSGPPLSMSVPYGKILEEMADHYFGWNTKARTALERREFIARMRQTRSNMPKRESRTGGPAMGTERVFLTQLRSHFVELGNVEGPAFAQVFERTYNRITRRKVRTRVMKKRPIRKLPSGASIPQAFPRTSKKASA